MAYQRPSPPRLAAETLDMKSLFEHAGAVGASDLLITAGSPPTVRVDGELHPAADHVLTAADTQGMLRSLINQVQLDAFERNRELDFSLAISPKLRFRANLYFQKGAAAGAFRLIPIHIPNLGELGLPPAIGELTLRQHGLILITGATGSGKSTTQAAMIDLINRTTRCHIVTIEDPIEFVHENRMSIIDQREVFADTLSFASALKYVLRQDPDVILVGEMRDMETIAAALTAAETGHLVIATLHTNDAVQAIDRIIDVFPPHQQEQVRTQLAFSLIGIIAQQLVPRASGRGRLLAAEVLIANHAVANHIREGKTHQTRGLMEGARAEGMITLDNRLRELYETGMITFNELAGRVTSPSVLQQVRRPGAAPPPHNR